MGGGGVGGEGEMSYKKIYIIIIIKIIIKKRTSVSSPAPTRFTVAPSTRCRSTLPRVRRYWCSRTADWLMECRLSPTPPFPSKMYLLILSRSGSMITYKQPQVSIRSKQDQFIRCWRQWILLLHQLLGH